MAIWTGWPPRSNFGFYSRGAPFLHHRSTRGHIDLADALMSKWPHNQRTVEMRLSTASKKWSNWDAPTLALMEENIRYALTHDGYRVRVERLSGEDQECSTDMRWRLTIRAM